MMNTYYRFMDEQINESLGVSVGFNNVLSSRLYPIDPPTLDGFVERYELIKTFQKITQSLFHASLHGEIEPDVAALAINELPASQGWEYHKRLAPERLQAPVFFRSDEVVPGKIAELQCPGSSWGLYEQLYRFYKQYQQELGTTSQFSRPLSENFSVALKKYLEREPIIHHLLDNASVPYGMRYFIQQTRTHGMKYFGYDQGITPYDCQFIRAHAFTGLLSDNYAKQRLSEYQAGQVFYDLPPSILFDEKISLLFPFWEKTRDYYPDKIRAIFPYTQLITPEGVQLEDGRWVTIREFCQIPRGKRNYYLKYAGSDLALNWGSKGVYFAGSFTRGNCEKCFNHILKDFHKHHYWILQQGYIADDSAEFFTREDEKIVKADVHSKFSGFYGPDGLMGIFVMQRAFYKVHGTSETVLSIV